MKNEEFINKVVHGDCLEWLPQIEDKSISAIIADLPYNSTDAKWDSLIPFDRLWEHYERVIKDDGVVLLFASEPFASNLRMSNSKLYKYDWYWLKNKPSGIGFAKYQPMRKIENICVFYKKKPPYNPIMIDRSEDELKRLSKKSVKTSKTDLYSGLKYGKTANRNENKKKYPTNILEFKTVFNRSKEKTKHPSQKPVELIEYLIRTHTNEGATVLDNTAGSGTLGVACINTNRNFILMEKEWEYCEIANERIKKAKLQNQIK